MKTAEETLRKYLPPPTNEGEKNDDINIVKSMQDYAKQTAIEFAEWCYDNIVYYEHNDKWMFFSSADSVMYTTSEMFDKFIEESKKIEKL